MTNQLKKRFLLCIILFVLGYLPSEAQWEFIGSQVGFIWSQSLMNSDTALLLTSTFSPVDTFFVYLTQDFGRTFEKKMEFPRDNYSAKLSANESWGLIVGTPGSNSSGLYGKQFLIIIEDLGNNWRFVDSNLIGWYPEIFFSSTDTAYFLSRRDSVTQIFGKIWDKGDNIQVLREFKTNNNPLHSFKLFASGVGYIMRKDTLFKTNDWFSTIQPLSNNVQFYDFINQNDGVFLKYGRGITFIHKEQTTDLNFPTDFYYSSNVFMINTHSVAFSRSWPGMSGGVWFMYIDESGQYYLTTIYSQGYGENKWFFTSPDSTIIIGSSYHTLIRANYIGQIMSNETIGLSNNLSIYPNPCGPQLNISFNCIVESKLHIRIVDMVGKTYKMIKSEVIPGINTITLNMDDLDVGFYVLHITYDNMELQTTFTKNHYH